MTAERVLVVGDSAEELLSTLNQALPEAQVVTVPTVFDALAELVAGRYTAVLAGAEPIERRPEEAVRNLRELAGAGRLLIYGNPTLEPLSRKMLEFGVDDYLITPTTPGEIQQLFSAPVEREERQQPKAETAGEMESPTDGAVEVTGDLGQLPLAEVVLEALVQQPHDAAGAAAREINRRLGEKYRCTYVPAGGEMPSGPEGMIGVSQPVRAGGTEAGEVLLYLPADGDDAGARKLVGQLAGLLGKLGALSERHTRLQKLAITDDLTGLYNGRYFRHFLARILERAKQKLFPVTLLIFDIDDFKKYNDQFGHNVGDEILKQTAKLIKRCVREHDFVARVGGDEFAVVFWEKEPRLPHHEGGGPPGKPVQTPETILARFQGMMASQDLTLLGASGKGSLTISGGLAIYPWHAQTAEDLITQADQCLMFGAKKQGKNTIHLVGGEQR